MPHRSVSSSERKGILTVGAIALLVTLVGLGVAWCGRPKQTVTPEDVEVLVAGDSSDVTRDTVDVAVSSDSADVARHKDFSGQEETGKSHKRKRRQASQKGKENKAPKVYKRRSPLDEVVPGR